MQPDSITLRTSAATSGERIAEFYQNENGGGKSIYQVDGEHTDMARSIVELFRTPPKRNGNSFGIRKSLLKRVRDLDSTGIDGTTVAEQATIGISVNAPVGADPVEVQMMLLDAVATYFTLQVGGSQVSAVSTFVNAVEDVLSADPETYVGEALVIHGDLHS